MSVEASNEPDLKYYDYSLRLNTVIHKCVVDYEVPHISLLVYNYTGTTPDSVNSLSHTSDRTSVLSNTVETYQFPCCLSRYYALMIGNLLSEELSPTVYGVRSGIFMPTRYSTMAFDIGKKSIARQLGDEAMWEYIAFPLAAKHTHRVAAMNMYFTARAQVEAAAVGIAVEQKVSSSGNLLAITEPKDRSKLYSDILSVCRKQAEEFDKDFRPEVFNQFRSDDQKKVYHRYSVNAYFVSVMSDFLDSQTIKLLLDDTKGGAA